MGGGREERGRVKKRASGPGREIESVVGRVCDRESRELERREKACDRSWGGGRGGGGEGRSWALGSSSTSSPPHPKIESQVYRSEARRNRAVASLRPSGSFCRRAPACVSPLYGLRCAGAGGGGGGGGGMGTGCVSVSSGGSEKRTGRALTARVSPLFFSASSPALAPCCYPVAKKRFNVESRMKGACCVLPILSAETRSLVVWRLGDKSLGTNEKKALP